MKNTCRRRGSLSANDFSEMLDWLAERYNLIGAKAYVEKFQNAELGDNDICLSFDDALLCQYDIALPILDEKGIDAFFFVYSSVFTGAPDHLEIFRYFRTNKFSDIDDFYHQFFELTEAQADENLAQHRQVFEDSSYLGAFPFYSENDRWFRYLRDQVLGPEKYEQMMFQLMNHKGFFPESVLADLWMSEDNLKDIASRGHLVGLHSFNHPTQMSKLSYQEQFDQYYKNLQHLNSIVGDVISMSHPCGDYNDDTLQILDELGMKIGFRSSLSVPEIKGKFEIPRDDHANVYREMKR